MNGGPKSGKHAEPENDSKSDDLTFYLRRVAESSDRSRKVLYLILTATAFIFAYQWRTMKYPQNWLQARIEVRSSIVSHWKDFTNWDTFHKFHTNTVTISNAAQLNGLKWDDLKTWDERTTNRYYLWRERLGYQILTNHHPDLTKEEVKEKITELRKEASTWGVFTVPFFNITFDDNDFVLFSELSLLILAVVLLYCLLREKENLSISFDFSKEHYVHSDFYRRASMEQVWSNLEDVHPRWLRPIACVVPYVLFAIPLFVEWWAFFEDRVSDGDLTVGGLSAWDILNKPLGNFVYWAEFALLVLLTLITILSGLVFEQMNELWEENRKQADKRILGAESKAMF